MHLGERCTLTFTPGQAHQGILFQRTDVSNSTPIPALVDHVSASERRTQLGREPYSVHTVEHVLAAVAAHGIDDLTIAMDGPEPPILDGSASAFSNRSPRPGLRQFRGTRII